MCSSAPSATESVAPDADGPLPDVAGRWSWVCDAPERLDRIDTTLFADFDRLARIDVAVDGPGGEMHMALTPGHPTIGIERAR